MNINDLPQYAIDDIALEFNSEPPIVTVARQTFILVGNVQTCVTPPLSAQICVPANKYTVLASLADFNTAQAYVNGKAQAELNAKTHFGVFTYSNSITFPGVLSPSHIVVGTPLLVTGLIGVVSRVVLLLNPLQHINCADSSMMLLLQSASGQVGLMMYQCGSTSTRVDSINLTLDDTGPAMPTDLATGLLSGTYRPTALNSITSMHPPAPPAPYVVALSALNGFNPNGTWTLWGENRGGVPLEDLAFPNGFQLQITTV